MRWAFAIIQHTFLWIVPILAAALIAIGILSYWKQSRIFFPYGLSIAADQTVLVVEREYPVTRGYRYVGTAREWQRPLHVWGAMLAINDAPAYDSELRKDTNRHWMPNTGMFNTPGSTKCSWTSLPIFFPLIILTLPSYLAWRSFLSRRKRNGCRVCGYDRSGLDPGAPCPECGGVRRS